MASLTTLWGELDKRHDQTVTLVMALSRTMAELYRVEIEAYQLMGLSHGQAKARAERTWHSLEALTEAKLDMKTAVDSARETVRKTVADYEEHMARRKSAVSRIQA